VKETRPCGRRGTSKCCAKHLKFYRASQAKRKKPQLTNTALRQLLDENNGEKEDLKQKLKRKHDEVEALQAEVKKLQCCIPESGREAFFVGAISCHCDGMTCHEVDAGDEPWTADMVGMSLAEWTAACRHFQ